MKPKMKFIKKVLQTRNFEETMQDLNQQIILKENILQKQISENHKEIISNCTAIAGISLKNHNMAQITHKITDFTLGSTIKLNEIKQTTEILEKTNEINNYLNDLLKIIKTSQDTPGNLHEYYFSVKKIKENLINIKKFKVFSFYDTIKNIIKLKKQETIIDLKKETDNWISNMLIKYKSIGERIMNNEIIKRKELDLPKIFVSRYINKELNHLDEYTKYFNTKRKNISQNLKIFEFIGFLYIEKILTDKSCDFKIDIERTNFEKDDLALMIKFLKKFNFKSNKQEEKIEKICCDYIFEQRKSVNNKDDIETFKKESLEYMRNVDQPCVYEILYKSLDDLYVKYFDQFNYMELNKKLIDLNKKRSDISFNFKTNSHLRKKFEEIMKRIDKIFEKGNFSELYATDIFLNDEIVVHIRECFISKINSTLKDDKRSIEAEIVKFYIHLNGFDKKMGDLFYKAIDVAKSYS